MLDSVLRYTDPDLDEYVLVRWEGADFLRVNSSGDVWCMGELERDPYQIVAYLKKAAELVLLHGYQDKHEVSVHLHKHNPTTFITKASSDE